MSYVVKLPDGWLCRGRTVENPDNATIYPHPSSAKRAAARLPGAEIIPVDPRPVGAPKRIHDVLRTNIYLSKADRDKAGRIGKGNASAGVRIALDEYKEEGGE